MEHYSCQILTMKEGGEQPLASKETEGKWVEKGEREKAEISSKEGKVRFSQETASRQRSS